MAASGLYRQSGEHDEVEGFDTITEPHIAILAENLGDGSDAALHEAQRAEIIVNAMARQAVELAVLTDRAIAGNLIGRIFARTELGMRRVLERPIAGGLLANGGIVEKIRSTSL